MKKLLCALTIMALATVTACSSGETPDAGTVSFSESTGSQVATADEESSVSLEAKEDDAGVQITEGVYEEYAFINIDGELVRYRLLTADIGDTDLGCVTEANLLLKWGVGDAWRFYKMVEYPERDKILGLGPDGGIFELCPYQGAEAGEIEAVRRSDAVFLLNGSIEDGRDNWNAFYDSVREGRQASIIVADCYTQYENVSADRKKAEAGDYPSIYFRKITFDGEAFTTEAVYRVDGEYMAQNAEGGDGKTAHYKYLRHFEGEAKSPAMIYSYYDIYILTDDDTDDWDTIESSHLLDPMNSIPYEEVYGEYKWNDNAPYAPLQR